MKLLCKGVIESTDKKVVTPFTKGKIYEARYEPGSFSGQLLGERDKRGSNPEFQIVRTFDNAWICLGVAKFVEAD
jgi:hypothetical protein